MSFREIVEGDVNYAKMHTQANPKYASGTKWRKSSAAVKAKADDVGAGELGAHGGGSGHVSVKATRNQHDKLATRQEINAGGHKTFAIKQTRLPRTSVRKPLPEGLEDMSGKFRELVEAQLDELSRGKLSLYIGAAKADEKKDRSTGVKLAQKKKWGDAKYGFEEPKVKATNEDTTNDSQHQKNADHALEQAAKFTHPDDKDDHHKWMAVHHTALSKLHAGTSAADSHEKLAAMHSSKVNLKLIGGPAFTRKETHHWENK